MNKTTIDFAISGITASNDRRKLVDFTSDIFMEAFEALYAVTNKEKIYYGFIIKPFQSTTWLCLVLFFVIVAVCMRNFYKLIERKCENYASIFTVFLLLSM